MPRPSSHHEQYHGTCCGNCKFARRVAYKLDLLCFHGDTIEIHGQSKYPVDADHVYLGGDEVGLMDGDAYDSVWAGRVVDSDEVCDEWELEA